MFNNVGKKIKTLARVLFWVGAIASFISGLVETIESDEELGVMVMLLCPIAAWIVSLMIYGFGELIDKATEISDKLESRGDVATDGFATESSEEEHGRTKATISAENLDHPVLRSDNSGFAKLGAIFGVIFGAIMMFEMMIIGELYGVSIFVGILIGIFIGVLSGFLFALGMKYFLKLVEKKALTIRDEVASRSVIICEGPASVRRGLNSIGGWLFITEDSVEFYPHRFNFGGEKIVLRATDIVKISSDKNNIIFTTASAEHKFLVARAQEWEGILAN